MRIQAKVIGQSLSCLKGALGEMSQQAREGHQESPAKINRPRLRWPGPPAITGRDRSVSRDKAVYLDSLPIASQKPFLNIPAIFFDTLTVRCSWWAFMHPAAPTPGASGPHTAGLDRLFAYLCTK